ncbi:MAG: hypothetical protein VXY12_06875 [Pseudomonadota bacterium]|jgi:negative regulator of sigma E activity|nr:hypothetical protein [Pseudomonadota bacterium]|tara:strand:- start:258 stop:545 length:288 start_codon:yes stop_codon:yes gene_type:complete
MKKLTIVRFKPKPEHFDAFVQELKQASTAPDRTAILNSFVMTKDDEVFSIVIRHADKLEEDAKRGVQTLDGMRHMLQEYNEVDRHTIPLTGDLVE